MSSRKVPVRHAKIRLATMMVAVALNLLGAITALIADNPIGAAFGLASAALLSLATILQMRHAA